MVRRHFDGAGDLKSAFCALAMVVGVCVIVSMRLVVRRFVVRCPFGGGPFVIVMVRHVVAGVGALASRFGLICGL